MIENLDYACSLATEMLREDEGRDKLFEDIDDAWNSKFENPKELRDLPWIGDRKFATTAPADALNAAVRVFATRNPKFKLSPLSEEDDEYERVERIRDVLAWDFERMNATSKKSPHWRIIESAMAYCAVAIEVEYVAHTNEGRTDKVKRLMGNKKGFRWHVHHPKTVHVREFDDVIRSVLKATVYTAHELIYRFGRDNPGIAKLIEEYGKDPSALAQTYFSFYDLRDWENRYQWIVQSSDTLNRNPSGGILLTSEEIALPFIPWVVVDNELPLLKSLFDAGIYENANILRTIQFSKAIDQAAHPELWISTPDGTLRGVSIDNSTPSQPVVTAAGVSVTQLRPPMIDPQLSSLQQTAEGEMFRTTVAQILASVEKYAGAEAFSTVNAMLNAAVSQLALAQQAAERAEQQAIIKQFEWIDYTGYPLVGYRTEHKNEEDKRRGEEIAITADDFDLEALYVKVELTPNTLTDEQSKVNMEILKYERLNQSLEQTWDTLEMPSFELNVSKRAHEDMFKALVGARVQEIMNQPQISLEQAKAQISAEVQLMMQEAQAQREAQANQPPEGQAPPQGAAMPGQPGMAKNAMSAAMFENAQGMDNRSGGQSPKTMAPGINNEQITGQAPDGEALA